MRPVDDAGEVFGALYPVRSINRVFSLLRLSPRESNDNAAPRAKVLAFKRPPPGPTYAVPVVLRFPQDVKDALCREAGFFDSVTDPAALEEACARYHRRAEEVATEALIRSVRARNDDGEG